MRAISRHWLVFLLVAGTAAPLWGQQADDTTITVTAGFSAAQFVASKAPISLTLNRWPHAPESRIAVIVGTADLTPLFEHADSQLVFRGNGANLPSGDGDVKVFLVSGTNWHELGRFPIRVLTPLGLEKSVVEPSIDLNNSGQLAEHHSGAEPAAARSTYQDFGGTIALQTDHERDGWSLQSQLNLNGTTVRQQALRFAEKGDQASLVDLADFSITGGRKGAMFSAGTVAAGNDRHLITNFSSRGLEAALGGNTAMLSLAAQNGSSIVGFDNLAGVGNADHRILSATFALEAIPSRPGLLHFDATAVSGSVQPQAGFTSSGTLSAEKSDGYGIQIAAGAPGQRLHLAAGFATSKFDNPLGTSLSSLSPGSPVVGNKTARYAELTAVLLQNDSLWHAIPINVAATFRHERVDPLYGSVAANIQADLDREGFELGGNVGLVTVQLSYAQQGDNVDNVTALLKTLSHTSTAALSTPLAALFKATTHTAWYPTLSYDLNQVHQFGTGVPPGSLFTVNDIPDMMILVQNVGAQWQFGTTQLGYHLSLSNQDNRQPTHTLEDLSARVHAVSLAVAATPNVDLGLDLNFEQHENLQFVQTNQIERASVSAKWRATPLLTLDGQVTMSTNDDPGADHQTRLSQFSGGISRGINLWHTRANTPAGQVFLRFAYQSDMLTQITTLPLLPPPSQSGSMWSLSSGLTLRVF